MDSVLNNADVSHRIKDYIYYFQQNVVDMLQYYLNVLEDAGNVKPSSKACNALSAAADSIPFMGKLVGSAIKGTYKAVNSKCDKDNASAAFAVVYLYREDEDEMRKVLARVAYQLFCCFEKQFLEVTCEEGPTRALKKLADEAGQRFLAYVVKAKPTVVAEEDVLKSVVQDNSNLLYTHGVIKEGRTIKNAEGKDWSTAHVYSKAGVYVKENETCYVNQYSNVEVYWYRLRFAHESLEDFEHCGVVPVDKYEYLTDFCHFDEDFPMIYGHILYMNSDMCQKEVIRTLEDHHAESTEHRVELHADIQATSNEINEKVTTILNKISEPKQDPISVQQPVGSLEMNKGVIRQYFDDVNEFRKINIELQELRNIDLTTNHELKPSASAHSDSGSSHHTYNGIYKEHSRSGRSHRIAKKSSEKPSGHSSSNSSQQTPEETTKKPSAHSRSSSSHETHKETFKKPSDHSSSSGSHRTHKQASKTPSELSSSSSTLGPHKETSRKQLDHSRSSISHRTHKETSKMPVEYSSSSSSHQTHNDTSKKSSDHSTASGSHRITKEASKMPSEQSSSSSSHGTHKETSRNSSDHSSSSSSHRSSKEISKKPLEGSSSSSSHRTHNKTSKKSSDHSTASGLHRTTKEASKMPSEHSSSSRSPRTQKKASKEPSELSSSCTSHRSSKETSKKPSEYSSSHRTHKEASKKGPERQEQDRSPSRRGTSRTTKP